MSASIEPVNIQLLATERFRPTFKLHYADVHKRMTALSHKVLGRRTLAMEDLGELSSTDFVGDRLYSLTLSIAAGTSQIQRNIVAERILGLPKER